MSAPKPHERQQAATLLNGADWGRIEAALREILDEWPASDPGTKRARDSYVRTLDKIERVNQTGKYTRQASHPPRPPIPCGGVWYTDDRYLHERHRCYLASGHTTKCKCLCGIEAPEEDDRDHA